MFLQNSQRKIEEEFFEISREAWGGREPLKTICEETGWVRPEELGLAAEAICLWRAPYSDLVDYTFARRSSFASHGLFLYNTLERVKELPERCFELYFGSQE